MTRMFKDCNCGMGGFGLGLGLGVVVVSERELKQRKCLFTSSHVAGHMVIIYFGHICGP